MNGRRMIPFLAILALALVPGCADKAPDVPETPLELPSIVEPVPASPTPADEGEAGSWEALPGLEEPARAFVVGPALSARGGLLLVHTSWGVNDRFRDLARRFADEGFFVVAPDLFEGVHATTRLAHEPLIQGVEAGRAADLILAAERRLESEGYGASARAALGVGVGGNWVSLGVSAGLDAAPVVLDTSLVAEATLPETLKGRTLTLYVGDQNNSFTPERLASMRSLVEQIGGSLEIRRIEGAGTTLLDERALGFSGLAYETALADIVASLDAAFKAPAD